MKTHNAPNFAWISDNLRTQAGYLAIIASMAYIFGFSLMGSALAAGAIGMAAASEQVKQSRR